MADAENHNSVAPVLPCGYVCHSSLNRRARRHKLKILPFDDSYTTFCNLVSGYRVFSVVGEAVSSGIIDIVGQEGCRLDELLAQTAMKPAEGGRFVDLLLNLGILEQSDGHFSLSRFAARFLLKDSGQSQRSTLEFESVLRGKWDGLGAVLRDGQGTTVVHLPEEEHRMRLDLFQRAMGEAARVRAQELWGAVVDLPEAGLIIDAGAGDGSYLKEFLKRHPEWQAVACDLPDVVALSAADFDGMAIIPHPCNLADPEERKSLVARHRGTASVLLFSNFIHCYGEHEILALVGQLAELVTDEGIVVIHDFFRDGNRFGALYDLHLMVNTFNGRTYSFAETGRFLEAAGLKISAVIELPSSSHAVVATRSRFSLRPRLLPLPVRHLLSDHPRDSPAPDG